MRATCSSVLVLPRSNSLKLVCVGGQPPRTASARAHAPCLQQLEQLAGRCGQELELLAGRCGQELEQLAGRCGAGVCACVCAACVRACGVCARVGLRACGVLRAGAVLARVRSRCSSRQSTLSATGIRKRESE
jgi:hypothetical protein